jgi:hypothetical protein
MQSSREVTRALEAGRLFSQEACAPAAPPPPLTRRYRWALIGVGLFLLFEIVMLTAGATMGTHF